MFESDKAGESTGPILCWGPAGTPQDAEMTAIPPTTEPAARTAAAERMRRHRQRRRDGLRCLTIELRETEIDALIRKGLLASENRHDCDSVQSAFYAFLDRALGGIE
jgi:hypothetical protein